MDVRRQLGPYFFEAVLDRVCYLNRIRARLLANEQRNRPVAVLARQTPGLFIGVLDLRDIPQLNGRTLYCGDDQLLEIADVFYTAKRSQNQLVGTLIDAAAGNFYILRTDRISNLIDRQPVRLQFVCIQPQIDFPSAPANDVDRANSSHRFETLFDLLVGDFRQLLERTGAVNRDRKYWSGVEVETLDNGWVGVAWQRADYSCDLVPNLLGCDVCILVQHKLHDNERNPFERRRAELVDAADRVDHFLDGFRNLGLEFFGACPRQSRLHGDGGKVDFGKLVDSELRIREGSQNDKSRNEHRGKDGPLDADFGELHLTATSRPCCNADRLDLAITSPSLRPSTISIPFPRRAPERTTRSAIFPLSTTNIFSIPETLVRDSVGTTTALSLRSV